MLAPEKVSLRARAEASSSISPIDSSSTTTTTPPPAAAPVSTMLSSMISPAERSASISQAADNLTWYDPTTWPSGIAAEVTQETDSIKDTIRKMNMLSVRFSPLFTKNLYSGYVNGGSLVVNPTENRSRDFGPCLDHLPRLPDLLPLQNEHASSSSYRRRTRRRQDAGQPAHSSLRR